MQRSSRHIVDRSFTGVGVLSILLLAGALIVLLSPIVYRGARAFIFQGTIEHRRFLFRQFERGDEASLQTELAAVSQDRQPVFDQLAAFEQELEAGGFMMRRKYSDDLEELKEHVRVLLGPLPGDQDALLMRNQYGQMRWDRAQVKLKHVLYAEEYDYSDPTQMGTKVFVPRRERFAGTSIEPLFDYVERNTEAMLRPRWTVYWGFLTDPSFDAHFFGGIWGELLGTLYLTAGAILFAVPMGVISAIYLVEYARDEALLVRFIRTCISTLAGVPSIVFGLFGLAFFINTLHVSNSKSVLAGSMTLAILILPLVIRSAEEAIRAVPQTYKEASLSLGASRWRTVVTVILPAALPGVLTGIVISMGRAAGETAPIMFTAAVSAGAPIALSDTLSEGTLALPWNVYNLCSEHQAVDEIRHVQYGMVLTLVMLVLLLNSAAIVLRARITRKLRK